MDLFDLIPHITTSENAINFLRERGIVRSVPPRCPLVACSREMTEVSKGRRRRSGEDDKMWRCPTHKNKTVSIRKDESLMARRKYHVGHLVPERWVFGMYDVHQELGVLRFIDDRSQATLFHLIVQYVAPGTTIHSDMAALYVNNRARPPTSHIAQIPVNPPYQHVWVNHTRNFVDPITGACTNRAEGFWKNAKQKNKAMSGTTEKLLPTYLDEFQWRQICGKKTANAFDNILSQIAEYYPAKN